MKNGEGWARETIGKISMIIEHPDAQIHIDELSNGKKRVFVHVLNNSIFAARECCETSYPVELIQLILDLKGPSWLCDDILREEDPLYLWTKLEKSILSYIPKEDFAGKRILDFGCGSGASTMALARMFPKARIVGVDINREFLSIARFRAHHYGFDVRFFSSPSRVELPRGIGAFDFVVLCALYEHLLSDERRRLLPQLWSHIKPRGALFVIDTPHRYFPIETHTTGLPFINYLPDRMVLIVARRFSKRVRGDESWESLLRMGIRGGTEREIIKILNEKCHDNPILLKPKMLGFRDRIGPSCAYYSPRFLKFIFKFFKLVTGNTFLPMLLLAIQKSNGPRGVINKRKRG